MSHAVARAALPFALGLFSLLVSSGSLPAQPLEQSLLRAAASGNTARVQELIAAGAHLDSGLYAQSFSPLMLAAQNGQLDTVLVLLESGAFLARQR